MPDPEPAGGALSDRVLAAMTTGLTTLTDSRTPGMVEVPAGEPVGATVREGASGETEVRYHVRETLVATRSFRVDERSGRVMLGDFLPEKYEQRYNGFATLRALHEQFVDGLAGTPCELRATLSGEDAYVWVPYYDWARDLGNLNAASLEHAVDSLYEVVKDQAVWDASDLSARVRLIAGPDRNWRHLIAGTTPAQLAEGIDAINPGLGRAVFLRMRAWHGMRAVA
jgi:hypothetical protein